VIISLTTDFGVGDGYVGAMKGVIAGIAPGVPLIDITHMVEPQNLTAAAYVLWTSLPYFPEQSVHLVVVDPGVGTSRRAIASRTPWGIVVGPDNGVFTYLWAAAQPDLTVALENPRYCRSTISSTFHGRDVFAPVAAYLAAGVPLEELGTSVAHPVRLRLPQMLVSSQTVKGEVIYIDRFGNAITSIGRLIWEGPVLHLDPAFGGADVSMINPARVMVRLPDHASHSHIGRILHTYAESKPGEAMALVGSEGMLEIAVNQGDAARMLGVRTGDLVEVEVQAVGSGNRVG
jgi:S-adenosyl-L-methionine hydrolase (adenosine-forming)